MTLVINILIDILNEGLMYALLAMGMYITYSILDFPDLSVDGTFPLGAVLSGVLIIQGVDPWLCLVISFAAGMAAGVLTGLMHVKLRITPLLCGIIMYTAMLSVNLVILKAGTDGKAVASFFTKNTIFNSGIASLIPKNIGEGGFYIRTVVIALILVIVCKLLLDLYLKTKHGLLLRATGANDKYTVMLGRNPGSMKIFGLALGIRGVVLFRFPTGNILYSAVRLIFHYQTVTGHGLGDFGFCLQFFQSSSPPIGQRPVSMSAMYLRIGNTCGGETALPSVFIRLLRFGTSSVRRGMSAGSSIQRECPSICAGIPSATLPNPG